MRFGQVIDITIELFYFKNHAENEARKLVPDLFLFFPKSLYEIKSSGVELSFNIFR